MILVFAPMVYALPTIDSVILNSTYGTNFTSDNLTVYTDQDDNASVKLIYNWKVNGSSIAVLNMPFETNATCGVGSNLACDYSGGENNATVNNGVIYNSSGGHDSHGAYEFDGVDDYLSVQNVENFNFSKTGEFTVMAWVNPNDLVNNNGDIISHYYSTSDDRVWLLQIRNGIARFIGYSDGTLASASYATGETLVNDSDTWYHLVGRWNGINLQVYVNGVSDDPSPPSLTEIHSTTVRNIRIGLDTGSDDFNGTIDEVMIFNYSLSNEQISALYNNRTDLIVSQETSVGDVWSVDVTPNDGNLDGASVFSGNLTVLLEPLPSIDSVVLNSSLNGNTTSENLTAYPINVTPSDSKVIYDWRKEGSSIAVLNMPFDVNVSCGASRDLVCDYSTFDNNGTIVNSPVWTSSGYLEGAYEFDGVDDYIEINRDSEFNFSDGEGFTVMAWVNPKDLVSNRGCIVNHYTTTLDNRAWDLQVYNGQARFVGCHNGTSESCKYAYSGVEINESGVWHHVAGTWNGTHLQIYVDGVAEDSTPPAMSNIHNPTNRDVRIGYCISGYLYNGTIDEVMIFNRSLSDAQISTIYNNRSDLIVSSETYVGDNWSVMATPNDGNLEGDSVLSNSLTIQDALCSPTINQDWIISSVEICSGKNFSLGTGKIIINSGNLTLTGCANFSASGLEISKQGDAVFVNRCSELRLT